MCVCWGDAQDTITSFDDEVRSLGHVLKFKKMSDGSWPTVDALKDKVCLDST